MLMEGVGGKTKTKTCLGFCEHLTHDCYSSYLLQPTLLYSLAQCQRYTHRVLQTIEIKLILFCVSADRAILGSAKTTIKFVRKIYKKKL